jgi:hypothetical protein
MKPCKGISSTLSTISWCTRLTAFNQTILIEIIGCNGSEQAIAGKTAQRLESHWRKHISITWLKVENPIEKSISILNSQFFTAHNHWEFLNVSIRRWTDLHPENRDTTRPDSEVTERPNHDCWWDRMRLFSVVSSSLFLKKKIIRSPSSAFWKTLESNSIWLMDCSEIRTASSHTNLWRLVRELATFLIPY